MSTTAHPTRFGPVHTEPDTYRLVSDVPNLVRACHAARHHLAGVLRLHPDLIKIQTIDVDGMMVGFCLLLEQDSPTGYARLTYDTMRGWTYCGRPGYPPLSPDCAFPLRPCGPPLETVEVAAEHIACRARQIAERRGAGAGVQTREARQPVSA